MKGFLKQVTVSIACLLLTGGLLLSSYAVPAELARAATLSEYDKTAIEDDLKGVDLSAYKKDEAGEAQLINELGFMEYAYSENEAISRKYYGLYFYVYNPRALTFSTRSGANVVNIAVSYDAAGEPTGYANLSLTYLDCTDDGLFYKFRLSDPSAAYSRAKAYAAAHGERRYDVAGIQLWEAGKQNAEDHAVSKTFTVTGYASGCAADPDAESTLDIHGDIMEVLNLKVNHTFYRTQTSSTAGHSNQIDSVYFSVPKRIFDTYGKLQRIKAEWYEYRTKEILVTSNRDFYNVVLPLIGKPLPDASTVAYENYYDPSIKWGFGTQIVYNSGMYHWDIWGTSWNTILSDVGTYITTSEHSKDHIQTLYYLFPTANWCDIKEYDPFQDDVELAGGVSSNRLYEYIKSYAKTTDKGTLPIKDGTISADLFEDDIDAARKVNDGRGKIQKGYSYYDFDADLDTKTWVGWSDEKHSFWENSLAVGLWNTLLGNIPQESGNSVTPIQIYTPDSPELKLSDAELSTSDYIRYADVADFRDFCKDAFNVSGKEDEEEYVVMFRFAVTDYRSEIATLNNQTSSLLEREKRYENQAYIAQETVFFDFDIIQLTFKDDDAKLHVIPCVSSPIDIVNDVDTPTFIPNASAPKWLPFVIGSTVVLVVALAIYHAVKKNS